MEERLRSARETAKRPVGGFLLDGFQGNPATLETRLYLLSSVTAELPEDKPRLVFSWDAGFLGRRARVRVFRIMHSVYTGTSFDELMMSFLG